MSPRGQFSHLLLSLCAMAVIPTAVVFALQYMQWKSAQEREADQELALAAHSVSNAVRAHVDEHVNVLLLAARAIGDAGDLDRSTVQPQLDRLRARFPGLAFLYVAGLDGRSIVASPQFEPDGSPSAGADYRDRDYFQQVSATGKLAISRVQIGKRTHSPNIQIAIPIFAADGRFVAYLCGSLDLGRIDFLAREGAEGATDVAVAVLDAQSRVLGQNRHDLLPLTPLRELPLFAPPGDVVVSLRQGPDNTGSESRAAALKVDPSSLPWTVVAYRSTASINAAVNLAWMRAALFGALIVLSGAGVAALLAARHSRPIAQLAAYARQVTGGNMVAPPVLSKRLPRELVVFRDALAGMIDRLRSHSAVLEATVAERTAQLQITNRELEEHIQRLKDAQARLGLADRLAAVGTLSAGVAHEINNPLAFVVSNLAFIGDGLADLKKAELDREDRETLEEMCAALDDTRVGADRVRQIVRDLKTFARDDAAEDGTADVRVALERCLKLAGGELRHRARVVCDFAEVPQVRCAEGRLSQVFLNLIVNAAQSFPESDLTRNEIRISTRHQDGRVQVQVADTGCGIPDHIRSRIFEPFFTTKPIGKGTGLGLAISHEIIQRVGGTIEVQSVAGAGTTFTLTLPPVGSDVSAERSGSAPEADA